MTLKHLLYILAFTLVFETAGDGTAHFLKNNALDSIQQEINNGTYKNKEEILAALEQIKSYKYGVTLEAIHDAIGERENTANGFKDTRSGFLGDWDLVDWIPDRTIMEISPQTNSGEETTQDAQIAIEWGEVTPVNFVIHYKQSVTGVLDYRIAIDHYIDPITHLDGREMGNKNPVYTEEGRIVLPHFYFNYYANDTSKMEVKSTNEEKNGKVTINSVIKVYQDSFSNIDSSDTTKKEEVQLGFVFEEDPKRTLAEFEKAYEEAMYTWSQTGLQFNPELVRVRTTSRNANSYFFSKKYYEENRKKFENYRNQIVKANNADAVQVATAFFYYEFWNQLQSNIQQVKENKGVTTEVVTNTEVQVYSCKFEDREEHKEDYKTVKLEDISWPDRLQDMHKIRFDFPLVLPKSEYKNSTTMTATELDKLKQQKVKGNTDLPQRKSGEESAEEVTYYTVYDWQNIVEEERQEENQSNNGQASIQPSNYRIVYDWTKDKDYILAKKAETEKLPKGVSARKMVELYKKPDPTAVQAKVEIPKNESTRPKGGWEL